MWNLKRCPVQVCFHWGRGGVAIGPGGGGSGSNSGGKPFSARPAAGYSLRRDPWARSAL